MTLPFVVASPDDIEIFCSPKAYQRQLLTLISQAKYRIYITVLYLENDEAGQLILDALYQAKANTPTLDICVFVDAHRAQRGLIGQPEQMGNKAMYIDYARRNDAQINIVGITVKKKELLGVLHLKGMVFDDDVLYSGASINNVYLHQQEKYRLDRYYQINSSCLANSIVQYLKDTFIQSGVAIELTTEYSMPASEKKSNSKQTTSLVKRSIYSIPTTPTDHDNNSIPSVTITPLVGCGWRKNNLNDHIIRLLQQSCRSIIIFTPYFNLPRKVTKQLVAALKRGVDITLIVGDKTASDFYISEQKKFTTIGVIPYIYEQILRRFLKRYRGYVSSGKLTVKLWNDGDNSYHLKGIIVDDQKHLLTGSNINPRAWSLDLENGLLIDDPAQHLKENVEQEVNEIIKHTKLIHHYREIESLSDYPLKPRKLLKRLTISKIDRLLKRFL